MNSLSYYMNPQVKNLICLAIEKDYNETTVLLASEKISVLHKCRDVPLFKELLSRVSKHALIELYNQYEKIILGTMDPMCTGNFEASMGLPCTHRMFCWIGTHIPLELIHRQWRIDITLPQISATDSTNVTDDRLASLISELQSKCYVWPLQKKEAAIRTIAKLLDHSEMLVKPEVPRSKGRLQRKKKQRAACSTRRDPSQFEYVESSLRQQSSSHAVHGREVPCPSTNDFNEFSDYVYDLNWP